MVTFQENQAALRLIRDNFPKSLLWEFNGPHMKQSKQTYIQNLTTKSLVRKSVRFSLQSNTICLDHMMKMEYEYIKKYGEFHTFPHFLKKHKIFKTSFVRTKDMDGQTALINIFHTLKSCPATSSREISLLYQWNLIVWCRKSCENIVLPAWLNDIASRCARTNIEKKGTYNSIRICAPGCVCRHIQSPKWIIPNDLASRCARTTVEKKGTCISTLKPAPGCVSRYIRSLKWIFLPKAIRLAERQSF